MTFIYHKYCHGRNFHIIVWSGEKWVHSENCNPFMVVTTQSKSLHSTQKIITCSCSGTKWSMYGMPKIVFSDRITWWQTFLITSFSLSLKYITHDSMVHWTPSKFMYFPLIYNWSRTMHKYRLRIDFNMCDIHPAISTSVQSEQVIFKFLKKKGKSSFIFRYKLFWSTNCYQYTTTFP